MPKPPPTPEELYAENLGLAISIAHGFYRAGRENEEVVNIAKYALAKSAMFYDPAKGVPFEGYAGEVVRNELIQKLCQKANRHKRRGETVSLDELNEDGDTLLDLLPAPIDPADRRINWAEHEDLFNDSEKRFLACIREHPEAYLLTEIAAVLGVSRERARQLEASIAKKMRRRLKI